MLDGPVRRRIDPVLTRLGMRMAAAGISANAVTWTGFAFSMVAAILIASHCYLAGLALMLVGRLCDGLDGAVARARGKTDFGGYLDIVLDFAAYGMVPLAFAIADPSVNALAACVLLLSFYFNGASFLAFAVMAEKRGMSTNVRGEKSIFFTTGLAEASETIAVFCLMCLFPALFPHAAWIFAVIVAYTTVSRIVLAARLFR